MAHGAKRRIKEKSDCFYYIPIIETLTVLVNNEKIREEVLKEPQYRNDGKLGDFTDGALFSNHEIFSSDAQALQIILYYDDCDLCNSAGSRVTKHKIAFFYFTLGNFRHEVRSKLDAIFLLAVVKTSHLKKYGFDEVLKPFLNDLKKLEDGYFFTVNNRTIPITGAVSVFCGDTPASNLAGGFKEGVSFAMKCCRHCEANQNDIQNIVHEEDCVLRTEARLEGQYERMENNPALAKHYSVNYGLDRRSILSKFPGFKITEQLPQDLMHILLEGAIPYVVKCMLQYYIANGLITVDLINSRLMEFQYGYSQVKDKPEPINPDSLTEKPGKHIAKDAAKMWMLFRILPFILHDIIGEGHKPFQVFELLMKISSLLLAPVLSCETVSLLQRMTAQFLTDFKDVFNKQLTPKMHYLIHCPRLILLCGPLVRVWNMRFEAKHKDFKRIAKNASFKNITLSLAKGEQRSMMAKFADPGSHGLFNNLVKGPLIPLTGENFNFAKHQFCLINQVSDEVIVHICNCKWVTLYGTKYIPNECSLLLRAENEKPVFGDLLGIWIANGVDVIFRVAELETVTFSDTLNSYEIDKLGQAMAALYITPDSLLSHEVLHKWELDHKMYINTKYDVTDLCD